MKIHSAVLKLLHIDGEDGLIGTVYWEVQKEANTSKNYVIIPLKCNKCKSLTNVLAEIKNSQFLMKCIVTFSIYCAPTMCQPNCRI
jgi:hypothetical protein